MIYSDSRYSNGYFFKAQDSRTGRYNTTVFRKFPVSRSDFYQYVWVERDRIDVVAQRVLGNANFWTKIMDFNPEISDPLNIAPGTVIRIPRV
jgi:hypothetical protein